MTLSTLKSSGFYRYCLRPSLWAPIWAHRWLYGSYLKRKRDRHFMEVGAQDFIQLDEARAKYQHLYECDQEPLVSITIATYNRARLLVDVVLPSALAQTYRNIEIIIVGDHCTDETAMLIEKLNDPRVTFHNLPERPIRPKNKFKQWRTSGINANNLAREMARGLWIAHLDDDDVFTPSHIEQLLRHAQAGNYEFVSGRCRVEIRPGHWVVRGSALRKEGESVKGHVSHSTVLRRTYTKLFKPDRCLEADLAGDTYMWHKMLNAGIRTGFVDDLVASQPLRPGETERSLAFYYSQL